MPGIFQGGLSRKGGLKDGAWRMGTFVNVEPELEPVLHQRNLQINFNEIYKHRK